MKSNALLHIHTVQVTPTDQDTIDFQTEAYFQQKNNHYHILYQDKHLIENTCIPTRLSIYPDQVKLVRSAPLDQTMVFSSQAPYTSAYHTGYGSILLTIITKNLICSIRPEQLQIRIDYDLQIESQHSSSNQLQIELKTISST